MDEELQTSVTQPVTEQVQQSASTVNGTGALPQDFIHQCRQVLAGAVSIAIACYDRWKYSQPEAGFSTNIDEILLLVGIGLIAGALGIFSGGPANLPRGK